ELFRCQACAIHTGGQPGELEVVGKLYRARQFLDQQTPAALYQALDLFLQSSTLAPYCSQADAVVRNCHCYLFRPGGTQREAAVPAARPAAERALELVPSSAEVNAAVGTMRAWLDGDCVAAEAAFQRALRPGKSARAARLYGVWLTTRER